MKKYFYSLLTIFISIQSFGHGEDKPGPNGGFIKMPGTFHTEVVFDNKDDSFHLYLLDLEFKNPTVKNSSVEALVEQKASKIKFKCNVMAETHYHCKAEKSYDPRAGKLIINAKREKALGTSTYNLPLDWANKTTPEPMDHSKHH